MMNIRFKILFPLLATTLIFIILKQTFDFNEIFYNKFLDRPDSEYMTNLMAVWKENSAISAVYFKNLPNITMGQQYSSLFDDSNSSFCPENGRKLQMLLIIHSPPENFENRLLIRETWKFYEAFNTIKIVFLTGKTFNESVENDVKIESDKFDDLLRIDILDNPQNSSSKSVAMLEWTLKKCQYARYLVKTVDTSFLNIPEILTWIHNAKYQRKILGTIMKNVRPIRQSTDQKDVSEAQYSGEFYPPYINGVIYFITIDLIKDLYYTALETPFFPLEDVFLHGFVSLRLGGVHEKLPGIHSSLNDSVAKSFSSFLGGIETKADVIFKLWQLQFEYYEHKILDNFLFSQE